MTGLSDSNILVRHRYAHFVSWHPDDTRYDPDTGTQIAGYRRGKYKGSTKKHWLIDIDGATTKLAKDRWTPCLK